jgi:hypothetical protein
MTPPREIDLSYRKSPDPQSGYSKWGGTRFPLGDLPIGQRVRFKSKNGPFKLEFGRWPFAGTKHDVTRPETLTVSNAYAFKFACYLKEKGKWVQYGGGNGKGTKIGNGI